MYSVFSISSFGFLEFPYYIQSFFTSIPPHLHVSYERDTLDVLDASWRPLLIPDWPSDGDGTPLKCDPSMCSKWEDLGGQNRKAPRCIAFLCPALVGIQLKPQINIVVLRRILKWHRPIINMPENISASSASLNWTREALGQKKMRQNQGDTSDPCSMFKLSPSVGWSVSSSKWIYNKYWQICIVLKLAESPRKVSSPIQLSEAPDFLRRSCRKHFTWSPALWVPVKPQRGSRSGAFVTVLCTVCQIISKVYHL